MMLSLATRCEEEQTYMKMIKNDDDDDHHHHVLLLAFVKRKQCTQLLQLSIVYSVIRLHNVYRPIQILLLF